MTIMPDNWIRHQVIANQMIDPFDFYPDKTGRIISYGLSSYGYDARLSTKFKIFTNVNSAIIDPKNFTSDTVVEHEGDTCIIPPNSYCLGSTVEYFKIPRDILVICLGKSTYARAGIVVSVTPLEPEWEGEVTLEICNATPLPAKIYAKEGICQFVFLKAHEVCTESYKEKRGKYMKQRGVTLPIV